MNRASLLPFDSIGIIASTLCAIHCIATPFIFIVKACTATCCSDAPSWWLMIDYLFLIISFLAIFFISKNLTINFTFPLSFRKENSNLLSLASATGSRE